MADFNNWSHDFMFHFIPVFEFRLWFWLFINVLVFDVKIGRRYLGIIDLNWFSNRPSSKLKGAAVQFPEKLSGLCQLQNCVLNKQAIFRATLWENESRSKKSATWVFFRSDPFSYTQEDFSRKWLILGDFEDPLSTILAVAAGNEMVVSRNSPV